MSKNLDWHEEDDEQYWESGMFIMIYFQEVFQNHYSFVITLIKFSRYHIISVANLDLSISSSIYWFIYRQIHGYGRAGLQERY